jgi:hypothetical protein
MNSNNRTALPRTPLSQSKKTLSLPEREKVFPTKSSNDKFHWYLFKKDEGFRVLHAQSNHQFGLQPWTQCTLKLMVPICVDVLTHQC